MSTRETKIYELTVAATGTGSVYFTTDDLPFPSVQIVKKAASTTLTFVSASYSNFSGRHLAGVEPAGAGFQPLTASAYSAYWSPDPNPLPISMTASNAPASGFCYLSGAVGARHVKLDLGSSTGGAFVIAAFGKTAG